MMNCDTRSIVNWLANGARPATTTENLVAELCDRLLDCGIYLWRFGLFFHTLHPQIMGQRFLWRKGSAVEVANGSFEAFQTADYRRSPVNFVIDSGVAIRRRLASKDCPMDFALIHELRAEGCTDYVASPLVFTDGAVHAVTWASKEEDGFTAEQIGGLDAVIAPLARVAENRSLRQTTGDLLNIYVGHQGGARILAGQIRRGHTQVISAVIWLSDMRGFTSLADHLPPPDLIDLLNRYFDCQVPAILNRGGEVLKFMGDGLLAIFPVGRDAGDIGNICKGALAAAREARNAVAGMLGAPADDHVEVIHFGLALHQGLVSYGNIGSGNRLDFTCIGPAVNLAARIEKLTGKLGRTILASDEFARHCPSDFAAVGEFSLPGFGATQTVFGLEDEAESSLLDRADRA
jgi:adenylate cyclase